ncbi:vacuolar calcium ion transporter [Fusarium sp. NRRL 52700]|nr:vacuolar calcium ion transporter [Fusarium sp. NRRL 52700]
MDSTSPNALVEIPGNVSSVSETSDVSDALCTSGIPSSLPVVTPTPDSRHVLATWCTIRDFQVPRTLRIAYESIAARRRSQSYGSFIAIPSLPECPERFEDSACFVSSLGAMLLSSWVNSLLIFVVAGTATYMANAGAALTFTCNAIAIVPLSALLTDATEVIAAKAGSALLAGSVADVEFICNTAEGQLLACLLFVSVFVVLMPTAFAQTISGTDKSKAATLKMSRISALMVLLIYVLYFAHELRSRPEKGNDVEAQISDLETNSTTSTNYLSGSIDPGSDAFSSQHLPTRTIRFVDDPDREPRSDSIYKLNNFAELETAEPSEVDDVMMDRGRRSGEALRSSYTRPSSYQPLLNCRRHSRSISIGSSRGFQSRDSSLSRVSRRTTALHLLREHRVSMDQLVHPHPHAEHSDTDWKAPVAMLIITSLLMSMCGEFLVSTIDDITHDGGLSEPLIGLVILPIVGNVAEYVTVVAVAIRGNVDLCIAVAVGSSIQIALCISPLTVMAGWAMQKDLDLSFSAFEMVTLAGAVLLVNLLILNDGSSSLKTSGLKGALMCACYVIFGIGAFLDPLVN